MLQLLWGWHIPATWDRPRVSHGLFIAAQMSFLGPRGQGTHRHRAERGLESGGSRREAWEGARDLSQPTAEDTQTPAKQEREWRHPTSFRNGKIYDLSLPLYSPSVPSLLLSLINGTCPPAWLRLFQGINKADAGNDEAHGRAAAVPGRGAPATQEEPPPEAHTAPQCCYGANLTQRRKPRWAVNHRTNRHDPAKSAQPETINLRLDCKVYKLGQRAEFLGASWEVRGPLSGSSANPSISLQGRERS